MKVSTILDQIDLGAIALPEFQRGYVWNRDQVRAFVHSLYRRYPVGTLLVWVTRRGNARERGAGQDGHETVHLLLDGQQRITTLYGIVRGRPPRFFEGDPKAFTGLYFDLEDETFEFYAPLKMRDNPLWVSVTELMQRDVGDVIVRLTSVPEFQPRLNQYVQRLTRLLGIKDIDLHIEEVTGEDKTVEVVVEIFNRLNSGGTKLTAADLALARVCAAWPEARQQMRERLEKWRRAGFSFRLEWFARCVNAVVAGAAKFDRLVEEKLDEVPEGIVRTERAVDALLNLLSSRLGVDHDRVLPSHYALAVLARYLALRDGHLPDHHEQGKLLYWYLQAGLRGRYAGSTETTLARDLQILEQGSGAVDPLVAQLEREYGDLRLRPDDFRGYSLGARLYPLLYAMARAGQARDWCSGLALSYTLLGKLSGLQVHHIFPKKLLYERGYSQSEANAIANYAFLTQDCNLRLGTRPPEEYLEEVARRFPGALESQWVPMERELWRVERYRDFLAARRELLAQAANEFLAGLLRGGVPAEPVGTPALERAVAVVPGSVDGEEEERALLDCAEWVCAQGLPEGELLYELADPETGEPLAILDLAWPAGLQEGLSQPVALLLDEPVETIEAANRAGYRCFTSVEEFQEYVRREILALEPADV